MSVLVTKEAPDFIASAVLADGSIVQDFQLLKFKGQKIVIFSTHLILHLSVLQRYWLITTE
mgnify:CR=1 FL=1